MDWNQIWLNIQDFILNKGWPLIQAILILIGGTILVKIFLKLFKKMLSKSSIAPITQTFFNSIIKYTAYIFLWIVVLQALGVPSTTFIAILSTLGLAIGLALKDSLSNLANGIIIISTKPFQKDDYIGISGVEGKVKSIQILTTSIITKDNKEIIMPNSEIINKPLVNYSNQPTRRVEWHFGVAYESDIKQVFQIIQRAINSDGRTLKTPEPITVLNEMKDSCLDIFACCWCDNNDYWDIYWNVNELVFSEFNRLGISIPYNQIEVRMRNDEVKMINYGELPKREEKIRKAKEKNEFDILNFDFDKKKNNKKNSGKNKKKQTKNIKTNIESPKIEESTQKEKDKKS